MALHCTSLVAHPSQLLPVRQLPRSQQDSGSQPLPPHASPATRACTTRAGICTCTTSVVYWVSALCRAAIPLSLSGRPWTCHFQAMLILCHISTHCVGEVSSEPEPSPKGPACHTCHPAAKLGHWGQNQHSEHVHSMLKGCHSVQITLNFPQAL